MRRKQNSEEKKKKNRCCWSIDIQEDHILFVGQKLDPLHWLHQLYLRFPLQLHLPSLESNCAWTTIYNIWLSKERKFHSDKDHKKEYELDGWLTSLYHLVSTVNSGWKAVPSKFPCFMATITFFSGMAFSWNTRKQR